MSEIMFSMRGKHGDDRVDGGDLTIVTAEMMTSVDGRPREAPGGQGKWIR